MKIFNGGKQMTVVCVDDHPIMLSGLMNSVQQLLPDASIGAFGSADEALGFAQENGCDVLISEIELSGVDGLTLAKRLKTLNPKVNIIFLTVCDEKEHAREVFNIKPSGYLLKPAKKEQLELELNNLRYSACIV
jgi:DNA-binding NarL/FixJ family response regulator